MMKSLILAVSFAVLCAGLAPSVAEARRIGGGGSAGMQRSIAPRPPPAAAPAQQAAPAPAPAATPGMAAAAAPKRSWMGPIAGLAAGLGIAALMSHLGMGAEFGNLVVMVLLALLAFVAIRFVMGRFARTAGPGALATPNGVQFAADASPSPSPAPGSWNAAAPAVLPAPTGTASATLVPLGFDAAAFERLAKLIFIRMQAANDSADLNDLRTFTTPEMYAAIKLDLQERGAAAQTTDVVKLDTELLEVATEAERQIVSVRFHGLIREEKDAAAAPFDEIWHVVRPVDGSREWAIAGIQQTQ